MVGGANSDAKMVREITDDALGRVKVGSLRNLRSLGSLGIWHKITNFPNFSKFPMVLKSVCFRV